MTRVYWALFQTSQAYHRTSETRPQSRPRRIGGHRPPTSNNARSAPFHNKGHNMIRQQLAFREIINVTAAEAVDASAERRPRLRSISIERDRNAVDYFNGVAFAPGEPHWVGFFRLVDDPVEYNIRNI